MKRILIPTLCASLLLGCDAQNRQGVSNASTTAKQASTPTALVKATDNATAETVPSGASPTPSPVSIAPTTASVGVPPTNVSDSAPPVAVAPVPKVDPTPIPTSPAPSATNSATLIKLPKGPDLPLVASEAVRLSQSGISDDVIVSYLANQGTDYTLNADQILYLRDLGVSMPVMQALLNGLSPKSVASPAVVTPAPTSANTAFTTPAPTTPQAPPTAVPNAPQVAPAPVAGSAPTEYVQAPTTVAPTQTVYAQPTQAVSYNYFYESLSPYGNWVDVPGYGWAWQPSVVHVDTGWRPYVNSGRWAWTDHGWYWHSDYSWGWAPFHYGRWHRHSHHGWLWHPDTVWSPAWVTWRYTDSHCGWAPLPYEARWGTGIGFSYHGSHVSASFGWGLDDFDYAFVSFGHFYSRDPWRHCLPRERNRTIIKDSTVVNIKGDNNTVIINNGIPTSVVQKHSREEIRKVDLRDSDQPDGRREFTKTEGERPASLAVYRPKLPTQSATPPSHILERQESRRNKPTPGQDAQVLPGRANSRPTTGSIGGTPSAVSSPTVSSSSVARPSFGNSRPTTTNHGIDTSATPSIPSRSEPSKRPEVGSRQETSAQPTARSPYVSQQYPGGRPVSPPSTSVSPRPNPGQSQLFSTPDPRPNSPRIEARPSIPESGRQELRKSEAPSIRESYSAPRSFNPAPERSLERPAPSFNQSQPSRAPSPSFRSEPAPVQRSFTPAPSRAPEPSRSYSPPPAVRSAPSPVHSAPSSSPSRPSGNDNSSQRARER